ncbi:FtsK/SpoIIIE domain-containing protein [Microbacterium sp.]|uniref:FtsK/SpoIIIE domain-containing protein n=1 Tax=Microbacterium sp. TaxID=51671 RepID=UPI003F71FB1C
MQQILDPPRHRLLDDEPDIPPLPDAWQAPPRPPLPLVAATVPIIGAVVLWLVTGSVLSLLLAALGPLIAVASVVDGRRAASRERRRAREEAATARMRVSAIVDERHEAERRRQWSVRPDVASFLVGDGGVWRSVPGRGDVLVVGAGEVASGLRLAGGVGDPDAGALRARAARLSGAPVTIPLRAGVAIRGGTATAAAVQRALVLQLCLSLPPGEVRLVGELPDGCAWAEALPHRTATAGVSVAMALGAGADVVIARVDADEPAPPECGAILTVHSPNRASLDHEGAVVPLAVEGIGVDQAIEAAEALAARAERTFGAAAARDEPVAFAELIASAPVSRPGSLLAAIGRGGGAASFVDLVLDGPHAVVAGVTGSGKSELLITWILALAATHSTREVSFLLADFKGGTAFDGLRGLPHVTGVITDLDGSGARRAIESLRAEVRWRESELARCGARDILDPRVTMPRLVIVVDEFAALLGDHPELHAVFGDVAARGRALGMHLVLGTQRIAGVVRDSLLANCPLRVSLRVTDAGDSRAVLGTDDAARLPGTVGARGLAYVRRGSDAAPQRVRIALSNADDVAAVTRRDVGPSPRRPWLPDLPTRVALDELGHVTSGELVLGLADEPDRQRQRAIGVHISDRGLLVVGGAGSGRSTALRTLAAQAASLVRVPASGEGAWDAVTALVDAPPAPGTVVVIDDLDALAARLSPDHAQVLVERLERVFRSAGECGILVVASAQRLTGPAARLGDLLPKRLVLGTASRAEHLAAGGDPAHYAPDAPSGRGRFGGLAVQIAWTDALERDRIDIDRVWAPSAPLTGLVTRRASRTRAVLDAWAEQGIRTLTLAQYADEPSVIADGPVVLVGDPDEWQANWRLLASVRADHDLVIDTSCGAEYRVLSASRELPPYADHGRGRAWLLSAGGDAVRIVLS